MLGYDPWLTTPATVERYEKAARKANASLQAVADNPVDALWTDRPARRLAPVRLHPKKFAGVDAGRKLGDIAGRLAGADAARRHQRAQCGVGVQHPRRATCRIRRCRWRSP